MAAFSYTAPTVGGSADTWGTTLNQNWANLSTFLGSLDSAELAVLDGITATTAELNILDGVTATAAEINILDGVTATTAEINLLDGVTATTAEINYVDGVTSAIQTQLDAKAADTTQAEADWEAGTGTTESIVSPAKVKAAIESLLATDYTMNQNGYLELFMGFKLVWGTFTSTGDGEIDVTFHEAFDNACWGVTLGGFTNHTAAGGGNGATYDMTLTGFKTNRPDNIEGTNVTMRYIAWGN